jgi:DNA invertase Pin-like site-specific DNA recombinase
LDPALPRLAQPARAGSNAARWSSAQTAAIDMIATGKTEELVCYSLDRLAREITVQEAILESRYPQWAAEAGM